VITKDKIDAFIKKIPPASEALKETLLLLSIGELTKAAKVAQTDLALKSYLKNLVNKPIYGFRHEVSETSQIFGILGVSSSQQSVYNYMISLLSPDTWILFKLNKHTFSELQARLSTRWGKILKHLNIDDKDIDSSISLLPASIIISEALFCEKIDEVKLLKNTKALDYNTILTRLCGIGLFDICEQISKKWEMPEKISNIIQAASGLKPSDDEETNKLGKWMHLLLFYELSQSTFLEAGLNDFIDFQIDYVSDVYDEFAILMNIS